MEKRILRFERLLDLYHHVHHVPDVRSIVKYGSSCLDVFGICKARTCACALFDVHMVTCGYICLDIVGGKSHSEFIVLDLFTDHV